ncbi:serine/threonine protein kinase [Arthrobacter sp. zg-Y859]|uniref:Serine/threonine protein kinase n=1 Tax=Arthrobacter jinronghuae TaxID=2964609 RepID=A0ABT1NXR3_9MICC|nr:serine/threonine-protein kinase [Arthrobacter jinronghuae]MCQ1951494.1 serine/threonine protein kinase [Arthrobacter jinronghuae]UWX78867.1 serine/threonine protein kinase [Arthrobacter jinronghuae]
MKKGTILKINSVSYVVESLLGEGGAGRVYKVRSSADGKEYALKQIEKDGKRTDRIERFRREITFGMEASNDHVVQIHAKFEDAQCFYYTMDLYPKNLRDIFAEESDYRVLLDYLIQLCDGLAYVHDKGIVHRDIKPENILIDTDNRRLVLADFGIAHFKDSMLTKKSELLANRNYQAPEQMVKKDARGIGKPADIFALGLIITEAFTKQNARGSRHRRVGDVHPFLSNLDLLVERLMLQDETQRITIQAARDYLNLIRNQVNTRIEEIVEELQVNDVPSSGSIPKMEPVLEQASVDVLSAKYIFERTSDEELSRYNPNYHCEISYRVSDELYNACVQSRLYAMCKAKFEYEANGTWHKSHLKQLDSPLKEQLQKDFEVMQGRYPVANNSLWEGLPRMTAHYFRFCKDYHCKEIIEDAKRALSLGPGSLHHNLVNVPILWLTQSLRGYLNTDFFESSPRNLREIEFEHHVNVVWEGTYPDDSDRITVGLDLFDPLDKTQSIIPILEALQAKWNVSYAKQNDGNYSIYFNSPSEYADFSMQALAVAAQDYVFEGDVVDLLRTDDKYDDLVAVTWGATFDIPNTLAKVLGLRDI